MEGMEGMEGAEVRAATVPVRARVPMSGPGANSIEPSDRPPSARRFCPVTHEAAGEARKATTSATSSARPSRSPSGVASRTRSLNRSASGKPSTTGLSSTPHVAVLTRMPREAYSTAR